MPRKETKPKKTTKDTPIARETTIHLAKLVSGIAFKKRAPRAVREIKKFAQKQMGTSDVRVDVALNKFLWSQGVRSVPKRVRVRLDKRHNEDEEAKEKMYTLVSYVPVADFHGLQTKNVEN